MSYIKYIVQDGGVEIAIKFNMERQKLILGGMLKNLGRIVDLSCEYFDTDIIDYSHPQSNKLRGVIDCDLKKFLAGIKKMKEDNLLIQQVASHKNLMR